jgi:ABC-type glycerol-3-phosphate transport system substrate-binding protein
MGLVPRGALAQDQALRMWWWGEQELPGLQAYLDKAVAAFGEAQVETMLQDTAVVISQFQTAAAAGEAPDVQYLWNGIYHMESVWFGYLRPLSELMDPQVLADSNPTPLSNFDGKTWRMGWYPLPMPIYYNKDAFERAGLDPEAPPRTWDEMLAACEALKGAGVHPFGGGVQDGYWGEWWLTHGMSQVLDSVGEAVELFIGDKDFRDPRYHEHWVRLAELRDAGFLNPDISSVELYPGIDRIVAGEIAMGQSIGTRLPADSAASGGRIGVMTLPVFGTGALAGKPIVDVQGLGISADSAAPEVAARFLEFLNEPAQLQSFWDETGWVPASSRFDASVIEDPAVADLWARWGQAENITNITNLMPGQFYEQAAIPTAQEILSNGMSGEEAGEMAARVAQEWRDFNPDLVERYQAWVRDLS